MLVILFVYLSVYPMDISPFHVHCPVCLPACSEVSQNCNLETYSAP